MAKQKVLITGGSGFAGSHLLELLAKSGDFELHATYIQPVSLELLESMDGKVTFHKLDLTDGQAVWNLFNLVQPTQVYQLASIAAVGKSFEKAELLLGVNTAIALNVLQSIVRLQTKPKTLMVSSAEVYGAVKPEDLPIRETQVINPANPYGVSKATQDMLSSTFQRAYDLPLMIVRPFNHIGERQESGFAVADFAKQIVEVERGMREKLSVGNLRAKRDFSDVKDIVRGYQCILERGTAGEVYHLGSGSAVEMKKIVDMLAEFATCPISIVEDPLRLRPADIPIMLADIEKVNALEWHPTISLENTLRRILDYTRKVS